MPAWWPMPASSSCSAGGGRTDTAAGKDHRQLTLGADDGFGRGALRATTAQDPVGHSGLDLGMADVGRVQLQAELGDAAGEHEHDSGTRRKGRLREAGEAPSATLES